MAVPFLSLALGDDRPDVEAAIRRVLDRGWFILGPEVEAFEAEFAAASGAARAVGVNTGTDAMMLILRALDIGPGDEVITTPLTAAYTALAIRMTGATPGLRGHRPRTRDDRSGRGRRRCHVADARGDAGAPLWSAGGHDAR